MANGYRERLQYDSAERLTVIQESVNGTPTQYTYTYDSVGRLTSATKDGTTTTSWSYDGNGNRLTENGVSSTFDAQDRLLTRGSTRYTWDALGGRKTKVEGGQTTQYTHDGLGALLSITLPDSTQLTYEYDARQRRVAKRRNGTVEARWVYDGQYRVAAQVDATGTVTHRFVYGSQSHSPDYVVTGGVTYAYVKNHLGSIRFVVNAGTGAVAQQLDYDTWGNVLLDSAPGFQPVAFAGGIYDRDTKLTHFGYRDYDSAAGVWTAKDPIRLLGDWNVYAYVRNDPARLIDPSGLDPLTTAEVVLVTDAIAQIADVPEYSWLAQELSDALTSGNIVSASGSDGLVFGTDGVAAAATNPISGKIVVRNFAYFTGLDATLVHEWSHRTDRICGGISALVSDPDDEKDPSSRAYASEDSYLAARAREISRRSRHGLPPIGSVRASRW